MFVRSLVPRWQSSGGSVQVWAPAGSPGAGTSSGPLDGVPHHEGAGGCGLGRVEHRRLHLRLHSHQCHGGAHRHTGERHHHPPVAHRPALGRPGGSLHLHPLQEALRGVDLCGC